MKNLKLKLSLIALAMFGGAYNSAAQTAEEPEGVISYVYMKAVDAATDNREYTDKYVVYREADQTVAEECFGSEFLVKLRNPADRDIKKFTEYKAWGVWCLGSLYVNRKFIDGAPVFTRAENTGRYLLVMAGAPKSKKQHAAVGLTEQEINGFNARFSGSGGCFNEYSLIFPVEDAPQAKTIDKNILIPYVVDTRSGEINALTPDYFSRLTGAESLTTHTAGEIIGILSGMDSE